MINAIKKDLKDRFSQYVENNEMLLFVAYTNCKDKALVFADEIRKEIPNVPLVYVDPLSLSVACHIGDGAIAVACARKYVNSVE